MPNSLPSTASRLCAGSSGSANIASSDSISRSRGPIRSTGVSFMPSGIQTLVTQGVPSAFPIAAPIRRHAAAVADPERSDALVAVRQREAVGRLRMREERGVEVESDPERLGPVDPRREMLGTDRVALDRPSAELAVEGVEVETMRPGDQRERLCRVGAELVGRPRLARIIPRRRQAAAQRSVRILEPADIVSLPAVQRDRNRRQSCRSAASVSTPRSA